MKTKEKWLEELYEALNIWEHSGDGGPEYISKWFSNALEQYAKEYCLEVLERCEPKWANAEYTQWKGDLVNDPTRHEEEQRSRRALAYNKAIEVYKDNMNKEIGV